MLRTIRLLLCTLTLLMTVSLSGAVRQPRTITHWDGLPSNSVLCIIQDQKGQIWVGTWNGLVRYDGNTFTYYSTESVPQRHLLSNVVSGLFEQPSGIIWVIQPNGLSRIDQSQGSAEEFLLSPVTSEYSFASADDNTLFCLQKKNGLFLFDESAHRFQALNVPDLDTHSVQDIYCIGERTLLFRSSDGRMTQSTFQVVGEELSFSGAVPFEEQLVCTYSFFRDGQLLLFTETEVYDYDCSTGRFLGHLPLPIRWDKYVVEVLGSGVAIIGVHDQVYQLDFKNGTTTLLPVDNSISCLLKDVQGNLWFGFDYNGLEIVPPDSPIWRQVQDDRFYGSVTGFAEGENGQVYVSTFPGGVYCFDSEGHLSARITQNDGLSSNAVNNIIRVSPLAYFVCSEGGVDLLTVQAGGYSVQNIIPVAHVLSSFKVDPSNHILWQSDLSDRIAAWHYVLDAAGNCRISEWKEYRFPVTDLSFLNHLAVIDCGPGPGDVFLNIPEKGLFLFHSETGNQEPFDKALQGATVNALLHGADSTLWIATSIGLFAKSPGGEVRAIRRDAPFDDSFWVSSLQEDDSGNIWAGTQNGICRYERTTGSFSFFTDRAILQDAIFNHSSLKTKDGRLFLGGANGFNVFDMNQQIFRDYVPPIVFNGFRVRTRTIECFSPETGVILPYAENFFSISFSAIDFIGSENIEYQAFLEGFDKGWTPLGTKHEVSFTNVPPGKYMLKVKSTNGDGLWCENVSSFPITVMQPWWWTVPARLAWALSALGLLVGLSLFYRRIKKRKEQEARREQERIQREEMLTAKLDFFAGIAHEFGSPLTLISGCSEQLSGLYNLPREANRYLDTIKAGSSRIQKLINELMDFRRMETATFHPNYQKVSVSALMLDILQGFEHSFEDKQLLVSREAKEKLEFITDAEILEKIFSNLISNAFKYAPVHGSISLLLHQDDTGALLFSIRNSGKGIKPEDLGKVFDRFAVFDSFENQTEKPAMRRNGLGLALVKGLVDRLSGTVSVHSEQGAYTQFDVMIPEGKLEPEPAENQKRPLSDIDKLHLATPSDATVLIVDDDAEILALVSDIMGKEYNVVTTQSGEEALQTLKYLRPDLILLDLIMPDLSGRELLKQLKDNELTHFIPVIIISSKAEIEEQLAGLEMGVDAYISKPFLPEQLRVIVRKTLNNRDEMKKYFRSAVSHFEILKDRTVSTQDKRLLIQCANWVESHLTDVTLSVPALADAMCMSEMRLYRKITALMGMPPGSFIRKVKLNHAASLLRTTDLSVMEVMSRSGFSNKSNFYARFQEEFGQAPQDYRRTQS